MFVFPISPPLCLQDLQTQYFKSPVGKARVLYSNSSLQLSHLILITIVRISYSLSGRSRFSFLNILIIFFLFFIIRPKAMSKRAIERFVWFS